MKSSLRLLLLLFTDVGQKFKDEIALLTYEAKRKLYHGIAAWVESFK
jgi:hypothetical protein